ncbi:hypothetical protein KEM52_000856 [Ascosphaera acerosa]|nr:hypothetical protein KEM52_000856 [Ascosphaera acerosa]
MPSTQTDGAVDKCHDAASTETREQDCGCGADYVNAYPEPVEVIREREYPALSAM